MRLRVLAVPGMKHNVVNGGRSWVTKSFIAINEDSGVIYIRRLKNLAWLRIGRHSVGPGIPWKIRQYSQSIRERRSHRGT